MNADRDLSATEVSKPAAAKSRRGRIWWGSAVALFGAAIWYLAFVNPLPSDEEMIAHFNAHRGEIEQLVKHYREYKRPVNAPTKWGWDKQPEIESLMKKAGVGWVIYRGAAWLPNPYSAETARKRQDLAKIEKSLDFMRRYGAIEVQLSDPRYGPRSAIVRGSISAAIQKAFYFFPEPPKLDQDRLWYPADVDGQLKESYRLLASLDDYPPDWKGLECVFRKIEPQWFIHMCRSAK